MRLRSYLLIFSVLLFASIVIAKEWWEKKSYTEWSEQEVERMLNSSPWTTTSRKGSLRQVQKDGSAQHIPLNYRIRLLSSRAVREALLRSLSFSAKAASEASVERSVNVATLKKEANADNELARLEKFIADNPKDIRVKGDDNHAVISICLAAFIPAPEPPSGKTSDVFGVIDWGPPPAPSPASVPRNLGWIENPRPEELSQLKFADLEETTILSTRTGKQIPLIRYDPPGMDGLGAKLYFPRHLPDGSPCVTVNDKELRFETKINGKKIKGKFDLKKLIYKGKLEI